MKTIPNFNDYKIDTIGNVYSYKREDVKILKQQCTDRYNRVTITNNDKVAKVMSIHRLVAITYIPNPLNKATVNHIDGNKLNNSISNLEWSTLEDNQLHADVTGLNKVKGTENGMFKEWFYIKDNKKFIIKDVTIKEFCKLHNQESNYSNVKKWCRKNHTLPRGYFKGYTFGYC